MPIRQLAVAGICLALGACLIAGCSKGKDGAKGPAASTGPGGPPLPWLTNYDEALKQARASGKVVLADFTGSDWCTWCIRLRTEVFDTPEFRTWAVANVVLLELDFPRHKQQDPALIQQNRQLLEKHGVKGFPTIVFIAPDGGALGQLGYERGGPNAWLPKARAAMNK